MPVSMTVATKDIDFLIMRCHQLSTMVNPPPKEQRFWPLAWQSGSCKVLRPCFPSSQDAPKPKYQVFMLAIPTIFDLIATVLMNIGLLSVTASVYQMMRGAEMFFAAIFSVVFLHRRLNKYHLLGIFCCVVCPLTMY
jgi:drug/metabolite transporter (DMT)-like permease